MGINNNRTTNIIISLAGFLCCIAGYFIPAGTGILADANVNLIQTLHGMDLIIYCAEPIVLAALSFLLICIDKVPVMALITSIAGGACIAFKGYIYAANGQAFSGLLVIVIGAILVITAAFLSLVATDREQAEGDHEDTTQGDEPVYKASDIYMSDVVHSDSSDVDELLSLYEETMPAEHTEPIKTQPATAQSDVVTDFYAGIEDIFLDQENGGKQDE